MKRIRQFVLPLMAMLMLATSCTAGRADLSDKELQAAFQWFDTLGYPSIGQLPFVRVAGGVWYAPTKGPPVTHHRYGFLMEEKGQTFTVFFPDLTVQTFRKTGGGTPAPQRIGYDRVDLIRWAKHWLTLPQFSETEVDARDGFEGRLERDTQMFLLARACAAHGQETLALALCNRAAEGRGMWSDETQLTFRQRLYERMARACMWDGILAFEDLKVPRETLWRTFEEIARRFPDSKLGPNAKEAAQLLDRMVREDREHASHPPMPLDKLTEPERVKELIFQLRDQNGYQSGQPGECDIFADGRGEKSPASQLVKMDTAAIPQLIEVLDDRRFTRSIGFSRSFFFSHHVLRIGDAAMAILERIAHREFEAGGYRWKDDMVENGNPTALKVEVKAWWKEYQARGEQNILVEAVSRGDRNSGTQAELLVKRYPNVALPAIKEGLKRASESWIRANLIRTASELKGEAVTALLQDQMEHGPDLSARLYAAFGLREHGVAGTVPRMIAEWRRFTPRRSDLSDFFVDESLMGFLTSSGEPDAMRALGEKLMQRSVETRSKVVLNLEGGGFRYALTAHGMELRSKQDRAKQALVEKAAEELLALELLDTGEDVGYSLGGSVSFNDPRICELAAYALSTLWPKRYQFKSGGSLFERDEQRIRLYNVWLKANGKKAMPLPTRPKIAPAPSHDLKRSLQRVMTVSSDAERKKALAAIEKMGLPALPSVLEVLHTQKPNRPARTGLEEVATRVACIVRTAQAGPTLQELDPDASKEFNAFQGRSLTATQIVTLLNHVTDKFRDGLTGVELEAYRDNDGAGFRVTLNVLPGKLGRSSEYTSWDYSERVLAGAEALYSNSGGSRSSSKQYHPSFYDADDEQLTERIRKALASPPLETVRISIKITRTK